VTAIPRPSPDVERVLAAVRAAGGRPMLVGGYVRDAVMGIPGKDVDIEVYGLADPGALAARLSAAGKAVEAGKWFGVLKVRSGDLGVDISLPRRESKTGPGHQGFSVSPDGALSFAEASARRDFTVNALMADPETGEVIDCHGGLADLKAGILRHTSDAFMEDPLRVLRGVQFAARFGFSMPAATAWRCSLLIGSYRELPVERVWGEWEKIGTRGRDISGALWHLDATRWVEHFPQLAALRGVGQDPEWHPEGDAWVHSGLAADQAARLADEAGLTGTDRLVIVFAALLHDLGKVTHTQLTDGRITSHGHADAGVAPASAFLRSIGCPQGIIDRIVPLIREHMNCQDGPKKPAVRRLARRLAPATMAELALVVGADRKGRGNPDAPNPAESWLEMARGLKVEERPARGLLTGDHLIAAGMKPGPDFKVILAGALAAQDAGEFDNEDGAVRWLAGRLIRGGSLEAGSARERQLRGHGSEHRPHRAA
jgi:tRNA nucleotidyltransferase (CCA-adding enzyme)